MRRRDKWKANRSKGAPHWFDEEDTKSCGHDAGSEILRKVTGYSDFEYRKAKCNECGETYCYWIEG